VVGVVMVDCHVILVAMLLQQPPLGDILD
jgi:hypothetical protein